MGIWANHSWFLVASDRLILRHEIFKSNYQGKAIRFQINHEIIVDFQTTVLPDG